MDKKLRLLVERVLKNETKELLSEIENLMIKDGVGIVLAEGNKKNSNKDRRTNEKVLGRGQFKSLMDAASEASCIEELLLFLSYQKSKGGGWKSQCSNGKDIAENVANSFMEVQKKIYAEIAENIGEENINPEDERILRLEIAEKYMGYLYWKASVMSSC